MEASVESNKDSKVSGKAGRLQGWLLIATCWLASAGAVLIAPVLPFMQKAFADEPHADILTLIVLVIPGLMIALFSPVMGVLVDVVGRKRLYLISIAVYAVAGVLPFFLHSLAAIIATRVVVGVAEAAITTISTALTGQLFLVTAVATAVSLFTSRHLMSSDSDSVE